MVKSISSPADKSKGITLFARQYSKIQSSWKFKQSFVKTQGVLLCQEVGGLGPGLKFGGKIWGKVTK